ncbi:hypothetical protein [Paenibacillus sp. MBLB4367]|uniref:hypothetical protein n=1 Tax=Paenibacillus sp. MBLB4367 TaxID=3384767 RepID=UPI003907F99D
MSNANRKKQRSRRTVKKGNLFGTDISPFLWTWDDLQPDNLGNQGNQDHKSNPDNPIVPGNLSKPVNDSGDRDNTSGKDRRKKQRGSHERSTAADKSRKRQRSGQKDKSTHKKKAHHPPKDDISRFLWTWDLYRKNKP